MPEKLSKGAVLIRDQTGRKPFHIKFYSTHHADGSMLKKALALPFDYQILLYEYSHNLPGSYM